VSLKKFLVGGTPVRKSTVFSKHLDPIKYKWGGLIDFYRSPEEKKWTDTGPNVPHYPALSAVWWPNIAKTIEGRITPEQAMDNIAAAQDALMEKMRLTRFSPRLNTKRSEAYWLQQPGAPKPFRKRPKPVTIAYDDLIRRWE